MARYVIMLDDHVLGNPDNWAIVTRDETLDAARQRRQYQAIIINLPRARYPATRLEDKSLVCTLDGVTYNGAIYSVSNWDDTGPVG